MMVATIAVGCPCLLSHSGIYDWVSALNETEGAMPRNLIWMWVCKRVVRKETVPLHLPCVFAVVDLSHMNVRKAGH